MNKADQLEELLYEAHINDKAVNIYKHQLEELDLIATPGAYHMIYDNISYVVKVISCDYQNRNITLEINGQLMSIDLRNKTDLTVSKMGLDKISSAKESKLLSPMPGLVLDILVSEGDTVHTGDHLIILEAMKMENVLKANHDSVIKTIQVKKGDSIDKNVVLIDFEE